MDSKVLESLMIPEYEIATEGIIINTFDEVINSYNKSSDCQHTSYNSLCNKWDNR